MVRRFKLVNASGIEWDLMRFDAFFHAPDGLGFSRTITSFRAGDEWLETDAYLDQHVVSGEMVFDGYDTYQAFAAFIYDDPLYLCYAPLNQWYRIRCKVQTLGKSEIGASNRLICPITMTCSGMWHRLSIASAETGDITQGKIYSYSYDYTYFDGRLGTIPIENGDYESPIVLSIFGPVTNPAWSLVQSGQIVASGSVTADIADGDKLVIDARPDSMEIAEYTVEGERVRDLYAMSDFSEQRFLYAPAGVSEIQILGTGGTTMTGKNKAPTFDNAGTSYGVAFTLNEDGSVHVQGTPSGNATRYTSQFLLPVGEYIVSGAPSPSENGTMDMLISAPSGIVARSYDGAAAAGVDHFTLVEPTLIRYGLRCRAQAVSTSYDGVFYPMIREANAGAGYTPYRTYNVIPATAEVEINARTV